MSSQYGDGVDTMHEGEMSSQYGDGVESDKQTRDGRDAGTTEKGTGSTFHLQPISTLRSAHTNIHTKIYWSKTR